MTSNRPGRHQDADQDEDGRRRALNQPAVADPAERGHGAGDEEAGEQERDAEAQRVGEQQGGPTPGDPVGAA